MKPGMLLFLCFIYSPFVAAKVYKWVDDNGVTHYSQNKPEGKETTQIKVKGIPDADDEVASSAQNGAAVSGLNCEMVVRHGIKLMKDKVKTSGVGSSSFDAMLNDPSFIQEGVDECLAEKSDPVKAAQWLCQQNAKTFDEIEACEN